MATEHLPDVLGVGRTTSFKLAGKNDGQGASRSSTRPNLWTLRQVVSTTAVSADYLLGYDVPVDRDARSPIGSLARCLGDALRSGAPKDAPLEIIGEVSDRDDNAGWAKAMVEEMVATWWGRQRFLRAQKYSDALHRLADRLDDDSDGVGDAAIVALMRMQAIEHRQTASVLQSPSDTWRQLARLQPGTLIVQVPLVAMRAQRSKRETPIAFLEAPFLALGGDAGVGVAWRATDEHDEAWFIDALTLKVRHKKRGRFLTSLTFEQRLARPGKGY
jgi:hypothetical protein